eukprot:5431128-Pyramimonas_sp.AAC.1
MGAPGLRLAAVWGAIGIWSSGARLPSAPDVGWRSPSRLCLEPVVSVRPRWHPGSQLTAAESCGIPIAASTGS